MVTRSTGALLVVAVLRTTGRTKIYFISLFCEACTLRLSRKVHVVDLNASTCDFVLRWGGAARLPFSVWKKYIYQHHLWQDGGIVVYVSHCDGVWGMGMKCNASYSLTVGYNNFSARLLAPAIPTGMLVRVPVRS